MSLENSVLQFLTFSLGEDFFAVDILRVQEIKSWVAVTPIPNMPADVRGLMNLRGAVVPVIDLRRRFGMPDIELTKYSVIVVVRVGAKTMGLLVDAVSDVLDIASQDISAAPEMGGSTDTTFMSGLAKAGDKLIVLLDVDRTLGSAVPGTTATA